MQLTERQTVKAVSTTVNNALWANTAQHFCGSGLDSGPSVDTRALLKKPTQGRVRCRHLRMRANRRLLASCEARSRIWILSRMLSLRTLTVRCTPYVLEVPW